MKEIEELVLKGLLVDLKRAESSYLLCRKIIGLRDIDIDGIKSDISTILQDLAYTEMILSLARLYDKTSKKYPTRCLKKLYEIVKEYNYQLNIHKSRNEVDDHLKFLGFNASEVEILNNSSKTEYSRRAFYHFESLEMNEPLCIDIRKLKDIRDKVLAHNENVELDLLVRYNTIDNLIEHAKNVISFYTLTYTGMSLMSRNRFTIGNSNVKWAKNISKVSQSKNLTTYSHFWRL